MSIYKTMQVFVKNNDFSGLRDYSAKLSALQTEFAKLGCVLVHQSDLMDHLLLNSIDEISPEMALCLVQSGASSVGAQCALVMASKLQKPKIFKALWDAGVRIDEKIKDKNVYVSLNDSQKRAFNAEIELYEALAKLKEKPGALERVTHFRENAIILSLQQSLGFTPEVLGDFINSITTKNQVNPMNELEWTEFRKLVLKLPPDAVKAIQLDPLRNYQFTSPPVNVSTALGAKEVEHIDETAGKIVSHLLALINDDDEKDEIRWYFQWNPTLTPTVEETKKLRRAQSFLANNNSLYSYYIDNGDQMFKGPASRDKIAAAIILFKDLCAKKINSENDFVILNHDKETHKKLPPIENIHSSKLPYLEDKLSSLMDDAKYAEIKPLLELITQQTEMAVNLNYRSRELDRLGYYIVSDSNYFIHLVKNGQIELAKLVMNLPNFDVNQKPKDHPCALITATQFGQEDFLSVLLEKFPNLEFNATDNNGKTALMHATFKTEKVFDTLFKTGKFNPNATDNAGCTALMYAVRNGKKELVEQLLTVMSSDAITYISKEKYSALSLAVNSGNEEIVELLLKNSNFNLNRQYLVCNDFRYGFIHAYRTPLQDAVDRGNEKIVAHLLKTPGVNVNFQVKENYPYENRTALMMTNNLDIVEKLLAMPDINITALDSTGMSAFMYAVRHNLNPIVERYLKIPGFNPNGFFPISMKIKFSHDTKLIPPLTQAIINGNVAVVSMLVNHPLINMHALSQGHYYYGGWSPLMFAIECGNEEIINLILNHKDTNVNHGVNQHCCALSLAIKNKNKNAVARLLAIPGIVTDFPRRHSSDKSLLTLAIWSEDLDIINMMLKVPGVSVGNRDDYYTPLHEAHSRGNKKVIECVDGFQQCATLKSLVALCFNRDFIKVAANAKSLKMLHLIQDAKHEGRESSVHELIRVRQEIISRITTWNDNALITHLTQIIQKDPELIYEFMLAILSKKNENPFSIAQWQAFTKLVMQAYVTQTQVAKTAEELSQKIKNYHHPLSPKSTGPKNVGEILSGLASSSSSSSSDDLTAEQITWITQTCAVEFDYLNEPTRLTLEELQALSALCNPKKGLPVNEHLKQQALSETATKLCVDRGSSLPDLLLRPTKLGKITESQAAKALIEFRERLAMQINKLSDALVKAKEVVPSQAQLVTQFGFITASAPALDEPLLQPIASAPESDEDDNHYMSEAPAVPVSDPVAPVVPSLLSEKESEKQAEFSI